MIKAILFDLGGVVLDISPNRAKSAFAQLGFDTERHITHSHHQGIFMAFEQGQINQVEFVQQLKADCNPAVTDEAVVNAWESMLVALPQERVELMLQLKQKYALMALSNTNPIHMAKFYRMGAHLTDIKALFEHRFYSYQLQLAKPSAAIYQQVLAHSGLEAQQILFLDDSLVNIETAAALGFNTVHIDENTDMVTALRDYL